MQLWHQGTMMIMSQPLEARAGAIGGQSPARGPAGGLLGLSLSDTQAFRPAGACSDGGAGGP